jgi:hypothetical protein
VILVFTAVTLKNAIAWGVTPCSLIKVCGRLREMCSLHLQGLLSYVMLCYVVLHRLLNDVVSTFVISNSRLNDELERICKEAVVA